ncbi:MAG: 30S ribosomal protein S9 [Nanoarchaeota archaeon]|nr:30S ribosomal protein S9 [Nanoarchaeota archaeon]
MNKPKTINTAGTRKRSVARAILKPGKGLVRINYQKLDAFEPELARMKVQEPLILVGDLADKIAVDIKVSGGGVMAQAEAARVALCRALAEFGGEKVKQTILNYDRNFLVADTRRKEVCKPNDSKARAKRQKSYR